ncbi:MAG: cell envelope biogenesis protein TolA [Sphingomonas bacterium]
MQRSEMVGLGVAVLGHAALFALLTLSFCAPPKLEPPHTKPIQVSLVDDVGLVSTTPEASEPAESKAPEQGPPEEAAAAAKQVAEPDPTPPAPQPKAAPPPKPAPVAKPQPKTPVAPAPAKAKTETKRTAAPANTAATTRGTGSSARSTKARQTGFNLDDVLKEGFGTKPSASTSKTPPGAVLNAKAMADIISAIARQIQPCADRQVIPGPGANRIAVKLNLKLNRDGTLSATPKMVGSPSGVDEDNGRYVQRVVDLGVAAFKGCSPLRLPDEYYQTSAGGWSNINFTWQLKH